MSHSTENMRYQINVFKKLNVTTLCYLVLYFEIKFCIIQVSDLFFHTAAAGTIIIVCGQMLIVHPGYTVLKIKSNKKCISNNA